MLGGLDSWPREVQQRQGVRPSRQGDDVLQLVSDQPCAARPVPPSRLEGVPGTGEGCLPSSDIAVSISGSRGARCSLIRRLGCALQVLGGGGVLAVFPQPTNVERASGERTNRVIILHQLSIRCQHIMRLALTCLPAPLFPRSVLRTEHTRGLGEAALVGRSLIRDLEPSESSRRAFYSGIEVSALLLV